jgi:uncharacterized protein
MNTPSSPPQRFKIFSDPVHGFISVPKNIVLDLIQTPEVQRLRRIRQLGVGHLVFPGAEHTRFGHALGAMALIQSALANLAEKGTPISHEEHTAALTAALLHDIGHGPYSHTLEHELIADFQHEMMSRELLVHLNRRFEGRLDMTIAFFDDTYERPFFHQLISSQLDMDRLDYLRRDSFFTGVVEGEVGVERILKTMRVHPTEGGPASSIMIESKGIYAIENYIIARRLMYWQVYLHKTVLAGDQLLRAIFRRVRRHLAEDRPDVVAGASPALLFFLKHFITGSDIDRDEVRIHFCELDDTDVLFSLKQWQRSPDAVLADLTRRFIERDFFRVSFLTATPPEDALDRALDITAEWLVGEGLSDHASALDDARYYVNVSESRQVAYVRDTDVIGIIDRDGTVQELSERADTAALSALSGFVIKPYVCAPKEIPLQILTKDLASHP